MRGCCNPTFAKKRGGCGPPGSYIFCESDLTSFFISTNSGKYIGNAGPLPDGCLGGRQQKFSKVIAIFRLEMLVHAENSNLVAPGLQVRQRPRSAVIESSLIRRFSKPGISTTFSETVMCPSGPLPALVDLRQRLFISRHEGRDDSELRLAPFVADSGKGTRPARRYLVHSSASRSFVEWIA